MSRLLSAGLLVLLCFAGAASAQSSAAPFTLRPGDRVELRVLRDSSLGGRFLVDEDGRVVLPFVGPRQVARTPWAQLRDSLHHELRGELADGNFVVTPYRRVYVLGFVQEPGAYFVDPTTPLIGAVALAGGASPEGSLDRIRVLRDGSLLFSEVAADDARVLADVQSGDQVFVDRRGWFDRNSSFVASALVGLAGIVVTLLVAR